TNQLSSSRVGRLLLLYSLPSIVSMVMNSLYSAADAAFVARSADAALGVAGLTVVFPLQMILMGVGHLIGIGTASVVSRRIGEGKNKEAGKAVNTAILMVLVVGVPFVLLLYLLRSPFLRLFGAEASVFPYAEEYFRLILFSAPLFIANITINNLLRGQGHAFKSMVCMVTSSGLNIPLDYLFVNLLQMGIRGAAWGTNLAILAGTILGGIFLFSPRIVIPVSFHRGMDRKAIKPILSIGFAPFLLQLFHGIFFLVLYRSVNNLGGPELLALLGVVNRIYSFLLMPVIGLMYGMQPIVGYNLGAGRYPLVRKTFFTALAAAFLLTAAGYGVILLKGSVVLSLFAVTPRWAAAGLRLLNLVMACLPVIGIQILGSAYFQAAGKGKEAAFLTLWRQFLILIPLLLILPGFWGLDGICVAFILADGSSILLAVYLLFREKPLRRLKTQDSAHSVLTTEGTPA
ncbi:MAG: MATE family efflux transporter, partial [Spirochaetales bacterium]|nr:MATE family efflux transporter [Spirochaetales bacterium]